MRKLALGLVLALTGAAHAQVDFNFTDVELGNVVQTMAVMGRFNVLVAPDLLAQKLTYSRKSVQPEEALKEVTGLAGATLATADKTATPLYLMTKAALPPGLAAPESGSGLPTDFNFKLVDLQGVAATIGVLGKFDVGVPADVQHLKVSASLRQIEPRQALFWVATVAGLKVEESASGGRTLFTLKH